MTLTVELPEDVAVLFGRIPTKDHSDYTVAILREAIRNDVARESAGDAGDDADRADFEQSCLAISHSVAQIETGDTFSLEECIARSAERRTRLLAEREKSLLSENVGR